MTIELGLYEKGRKPLRQCQDGCPPSGLGVKIEIDRSRRLPDGYGVDLQNNEEKEYPKKYPHIPELG